VTRVLELRSVRGTGGGPEKTILHGAVRHDPHRFAVTVCYLRDRRDDVFSVDARARVLGLDYVEVAERHSFDPDIWRQLVRLARERRFDIIHGHDYKTNLFAWLLARRTRAVALATSHGWTGQSWRERRVYYPADRQVLRRFRRVIAVSSHVRDDLMAAGVDASRVTVLLNGIDPQAFRRHAATRERMRAQLGFPPGDEVIGTVGRLERQKRFDLLIEAFAALRRNRPGLRLVIAGDGGLRRELKRQAVRLDLGDDCRFLDHRLDIADLHNAFDVFVQSSEYEGTPNAVLEAMAMETPLVATDVGGTCELARPGVDGLIVPPGNVEALGSAIASVLDDPMPAMARVLAARDRVEHDLSFAERTRRLEAIYDDLVTGRTRHPHATGLQPGLGVPHA
jgi:glycosyltransferase involved in cell wall biosynthesis